MNRLLLSPRMILLLSLALLFVSGLPPSYGGILDDGLGTICATTVSLLPSMGSCTAALVKDLDKQNSSAKDKGQNDIMIKGGNAKIPEFALCCALNKFQECLLKDVRSHCGKNAEKQMKNIITGALKGVKFVADQMSADQIDCEWDEWYFHQASPFCWSIEGQAIGGFVLLLLFTCCCCCCCCCCRRRSGKTHVPVVIPYPTNLQLTGTGRQSQQFQYQRFGGSQV